jgi:hypothetical protein
MSPALVFSRETQPIGHTWIQRGIYYELFIHIIMKVEKFSDLLSATGNP